ncbi:MAG: 16S rRNA (adenine(1518)-N(6)/adenine(1519)-N(6))-dimethyltransferase RsmA [Candidatus Omnitrophica bacterium]|nr:16S rRNA (adenine(1518)-N(6)/adenine(1519)-N(6))-dimethyltransferase RsmA [Candidatus Omnitrophota bacterium]
MRQNRSFSQIFLKDKYYIGKVVSKLDCRGKSVLEIGSGAGQISKIIAKKAKFLYCVEIDPTLVKATREELAKAENTEIIQADIRDISLIEFKKNLLIFSNVPYHLSSKLIEYLVFYKKKVTSSYLILQKEFAKKISAKPGSKVYGPISCLVQYYAKIKHLFDIPAGAFRPSPKVSSSFVELKFFKEALTPVKDKDFFFKFIKLSFRQRRKKISTLIKQEFSDESLKLLSKLNIDLSQRPEQIALEDFCKISDCLYDFNNS